MWQKIDDTRIQALRPLIPPAILMEDFPVSQDLSAFIAKSRRELSAIFTAGDDRVAVVVGPCSIHDPVAALDYALKHSGVSSFNLGTGNGTSVLQLVEAFSKVSGRVIPIERKPRRAGDLPSYYADASLAERVLNWTAKRGIDEMCADSWNWQSNNPNGYGD
jgi:nucleoside-diphosphate-sugar epimerase